MLFSILAYFSHGFKTTEKNHKGADKSVTYGHENLSGVVTFCSTIFFFFMSMPGSFGV